MKLNYVMLSEHELSLLRARARRGWICFGVGCALCAVSAFATGYRTGRERALFEVQLVQANQENTVKHLEKAWRDQRNGIDMIHTLAEVTRERDEVVRYNQENICPDLQKATASRKSVAHLRESP